jgi:RNA polymerase sigma-70 factor (ECF subfamily)
VEQVQTTQAVPRLAPAAFTVLVDRHQHALHVFLRGLAEHAEQARDLVQDTFHDAWRASLAGTPPFVRGVLDDEVRRWLFHTAYRKAISALRRRRLIRWESLDRYDDYGELPPTPDHAATPSFEDRLAEGEALRAALDALSPQDAACLLLRVVQGFSAAEVGVIVGATPEVVTKRLSRAKQRLRAAYFAHATDRKEQGNP